MLNLGNVNIAKDIVNNEQKNVKTHTLSLYKDILFVLEKNNKLKKINGEFYADMDKEEFENILKEVGSISSYQTNKVKAFYLKNLFSSMGHDFTFNTFNTSEIVKDSNEFFTKEEVLNIIDSLINPQDQLIIYGLFFGLSIEELINIKEEDVDFKKNIIKLKDRTVEMDEDLKNIILSTLETDVYFKSGDITSTNSYYKFEDSPYILKVKPQKKQGYENHFKVAGIRSRIYSINNTFDNINISPKRLMTSGIMHRIHEQILAENLDVSNKTLEYLKQKYGYRFFTSEMRLNILSKY